MAHSSFLSLDQYRDLVGAVYAGAIGHDGWSGVLAQANRLVGGRWHWHLYGQDLQSADTVMTGFDGYDPAFLDSYARDFAFRNPWTATFDRVAVGSLQATHRLTPLDELERSEFYQDWVRPQEDRVGGGGALLFRETDRVVAFGAHIRRRDMEEDQPVWAEVMRLMVPQLRQAFEVARSLAASRLSASAARLTGAPTDAVLILQADRKLHWGCDGALALIEEGRLLRMDARGRLRAVHGRADTAIRAALASLSQGAEPRLPDLMLKEGLAAGWRMRGVPILPEAAGDVRIAGYHMPAAPCLMLTFRRERGAEGEIAMLVARLGMTPAEAAVARALWQGQGLREIAQMRGVSLHTVRNQLRAALSRRDLTRQSDLVREVERALSGG